MPTLEVPLRCQTLRADAGCRMPDAGGRVARATVMEPRTLPTERAAVLLCDVWDRRWCRSANVRLAVLLPRMHQLVGVTREAAALIVHAPSETMAYYEGTPARPRTATASPRACPAPHAHADPPLPIDAGDEGCDATPPGPPRRAWPRQHPAIEIDQDRDAISDKGDEIYGLYRARGIEPVFLMGEHPNRRVLPRSFAIAAGERLHRKVLVALHDQRGTDPRAGGIIRLTGRLTDRPPAIVKGAIRD